MNRKKSCTKCYPPRPLSYRLIFLFALRLLIMNTEEGMLLGNFINPLLGNIKAVWQLCHCFFTEENLHCAAGIFPAIRLKE